MFFLNTVLNILTNQTYHNLVTTQMRLRESGPNPPKSGIEPVSSFTKVQYANH